jgi:hypothetical protein
MAIVHHVDIFSFESSPTAAKAAAAYVHCEPTSPASNKISLTVWFHCYQCELNTMSKVIHIPFGNGGVFSRSTKARVDRRHMAATRNLQKVAHAAKPRNNKTRTLRQAAVELSLPWHAVVAVAAVAAAVAVSSASSPVTCAHMSQQSVM